MERCIKSDDILSLIDRVTDLKLPDSVEAARTRIVLHLCNWLQEEIPDEPACKPCACK